jgi:hypothetical protein
MGGWGAFGKTFQLELAFKKLGEGGGWG